MRVTVAISSIGTSTQDELLDATRTGDAHIVLRGRVERSREDRSRVDLVVEPRELRITTPNGNTLVGLVRPRRENLRSDGRINSPRSSYERSSSIEDQPRFSDLHMRAHWATRDNDENDPFTESLSHMGFLDPDRR